MNELIAGRYEIIRPLAEGGMATVYLAKQLGAGGFAKLVCVKRMLAHLAASQRFTEMFLDEGRIAADLRHPNVVQVLEAGSCDNHELFLAMEYLEGLDSGRLISRHLQRGERLSLGVACQIVIDAAAGLAYAHQKRDLDGEPLELIHRDISPHNLFVTIDGVTKVVDFGIAKARSQTTMTEAGTLKGKCAYMAPEMVCGDPIDHRADQFALGVVLFELTTGQRLFRRETDVDTLRAVLACEIPKPSDVVGDFPAGLEAIVLRALSQRPGDRFLGCDELGLALEEWCDETRIRRGPRAVAAAVRARLHDPAPPGPREEPTLPARMRSPTLVSAPESARESTPPLVEVTSAPAAPELIGRDDEMNAIIAALEESRAPPGPVTLVGRDGAGKSHLARAMAARVTSSWLIDLAGAECDEDAVTLLSWGLGLSPDALPVEARKAGAIAARALKARGGGLVILDGVDGVRPTAAVLAHELAQATRVLVTARAPLEVMNERIVEIGPLAVAGFDDGSKVIRRSPAVALLLQAAGPAGDVEDPQGLLDVVHATDRLPLSLLLAGKLLAERRGRPVADELARRKDDVSEEHSPLAHLDDVARALVLRVCVHRGPLDALVVAALVPEHDPNLTVERLRAALIGGSQSPHAVELLPPLREAALDELAAKGELKEAQLVHARAMARLIAPLTERLDESGGDDRLLVLTLLHHALEDALNRLLEESALDVDDTAHMLQLALALDAIVARRGGSLAHLRTLDDVVRRAHGVDDKLLARVLEARADHWKVRGRVDEARRDYVAALDLADHDATLVSILHRNLADLDLEAGELVAADTHARIAVANGRSARAPRLVARATWTLGRIALRSGHVAEAEVLFDTALATFTRNGDERFAARCTFELARCAEAAGDVQTARRLFSQALVGHEVAHDVLFSERARANLGMIAAWSGDRDEARGLLEQARASARSRGDVKAEASLIVMLADLIASSGDDASASAVRAELAQLT